VRLGEYIEIKYINVSSTESTIVMKSVDKNCKSDHVEGREEIMAPKPFSREKK
jgi:hypothetical protein